MLASKSSPGGLLPKVHVKFGLILGGTMAAIGAILLPAGVHGAGYSLFQIYRVVNYPSFYIAEMFSGESGISNLWAVLFLVIFQWLVVGVGVSQAIRSFSARDKRI